MRVLQVTPRYLPHIGGIETHVKEVTSRLSHLGVDVSIATTVTDEAPSGAAIVSGIHVHRHKSWPGNADYGLAPDLYSYIRRGQWDLIHIQGVHTFVSPIAMLAALRSNVPYVLTFHTGGHSSRLRNAVRGTQWRLLAPMLRRASRLIGVSEFEKHYFSSVLCLSLDRFSVVPNGGHLPFAPNANDHRDDGKLIVSIGRLERYKGHHRAIAAMPAVLESEPSARLMILGSGPYKDHLCRQADQLGVAGNVEIRSIPSDRREQMAETLSSASLVVMLSDYEAHPVAAMEAICLRRPMLVFDSTGLRELADRGLATRVDIKSSADQIAQAFVSQLRSPVHPPEVSLPTWDNCAEALHAIYLDTMRQRACA
jgi:glycosyltransferase involved in cell wall biosynthesis